MAFVQLASGEIFTTPNFASQPTMGTTARSVLWSRRMPLIQASKFVSTRWMTTIFRSWQQRLESVR